MSFTVYKKKKNGDTVPIKLSIWDAFHGCPNSTRKKKNACVCCGKYHGMAQMAKSQNGKCECVRNRIRGNESVANKQVEGKKPASKEGNSNRDDLATHWTPSVPAFTQEEDEIILRMKGEVPSLPWTKIAKALGGKGSKSEINERYKELKAKLGGANWDDRKPGENNRTVAKEHKADKAGDVDIRDHRDQQAEVRQDQVQVHENMGEKPSLATLSDSNVKIWADRYDKQKWIVIASKHFDKTGQRITPEQARKLVEGG
ncbi:hypothetical protein DV736_g1424, partial [Chaetothyriales sp. CBS 134916]